MPTLRPVPPGRSSTAGRDQRALGVHSMSPTLSATSSGVGRHRRSRAAGWRGRGAHGENAPSADHAEYDVGGGCLLPDRRGANGPPDPGEHRLDLLVARRRVEPGGTVEIPDGRQPAPGSLARRPESLVGQEGAQRLSGGRQRAQSPRAAPQLEDPKIASVGLLRGLGLARPGEVGRELERGGDAAGSAGCSMMASAVQSMVAPREGALSSVK